MKKNKKTQLDNSKEIEPKLVSESNLIIDAIYKSQNHNNASGDVLTKIFNVGVNGGFRKSGKKPNRINYMVLSTSNENENWIDTIDNSTGYVEYFGDNKKPGNDLHNTSNGGNMFLKSIFNSLHSGKREEIPPIFLFQKAFKRDIRFKGLIVPGQEGIHEDLVAVWKSEKGNRYQNYKAKFSILDEAEISKEWIKSLENGEPYINKYTPENWRKWVEDGVCNRLVCEPIEEVKTKKDQFPTNPYDVSLINTIHEYFESEPTEFEKMAAKIVQIMDHNIISCDVTRKSRDGGRDAIGIYQIGTAITPLKITFALEAKLYSSSTVTGVKDIARLISRIKHREFGIFVTTSYIGQQAYKEMIIEDKHPILIITAIDIIKILKNIDITTVPKLEKWLEDNFPYKTK